MALQKIVWGSTRTYTTFRAFLAGVHLRPLHPPSQEATAVKPWRNAERVPAEALAKAGSFGGFRRSQVGATAVKPWGSTGVLPHGISVRTER